MTRPLFLLLTALALTAGLSRPGPAAGQGARPRPNVVLILADDLGYECLSSSGSASYKTPHLDSLAQGGARFTHCYTVPLCTPTRVQLMTGRISPRNYVRFGTLPKGERTFAHMLKEAGYATGVAGKWQLEDQGGQTAQEAGFDEYCLWNYQQDGLTAIGDRYADPNLIYLDRATGKAAFRKFDGGYGPDVCRDYLLDFVERSARARKPFLAYYPMMLTHNPFQPTPNSAEWKTGDRHASGKRYFKDMVEYMDVEVGRIVKKLEELGVRENTLVLFTGDNGTLGQVTSQMQDGGTVTGGKGKLTDNGTHEPLIVSWPAAVRPGQVRDDLVDSTDFLPTLAEATGASLPKPPGDGKIDGRSFLPQLRGEKGNPREWVLLDYRTGRPRENGNEGRFVRDRHWKLYGAGPDGAALFRSGQLFDMQADPGETKPVPAGDPEADAARKRLQAVLDGHPHHSAALRAR